MSLGLRPPNFAALGAAAGAEPNALPEKGVAGAADPPKGLGAGAEANGLGAGAEANGLGAGAEEPNGDMAGATPNGCLLSPPPNAVLDEGAGADVKGLGAELVVELAPADANGDGAGAEPNGDLLAPPPPNAGVVPDEGAGADVKGLGAELVVELAAAEPNGDLLAPPPREAFKLPKPNDVPLDGTVAGAGAGAEEDAALSSSGLAVLYFCASLANISGSLPFRGKSNGRKSVSRANTPTGTETTKDSPCISQVSSSLQISLLRCAPDRSQSKVCGSHAPWPPRWLALEPRYFSLQGQKEKVLEPQCFSLQEQRETTGWQGSNQIDFGSEASFGKELQQEGGQEAPLASAFLAGCMYTTLMIAQQTMLLLFPCTWPSTFRHRLPSRD